MNGNSLSLIIAGVKKWQNVIFSVIVINILYYIFPKLIILVWQYISKSKY